MKTIHDEKAGRFTLASDEGAALGYIAYQPAGEGKISAVTTQVAHGNEGKGYGSLLVDSLAEYARQNHLTIQPDCPFVQALFDKKPEKYADVAAK